MLFHLTELPALTLHEQIANQIISKIADEELLPESCLLPARSLAVQQRISRKTIEKAYHDLQESGFIQQSKDGEFIVCPISDRQRLALKRYRQLQHNIQTIGYLQALEKFQFEEELEMARKIQTRLLPRQLPETDTFLMAASNESSQAVGGDFYDYAPIDGQHAAIVIADASGNGLPAALLIAQIQAILKSDIQNGVALGKTMQNLNRHLKNNSDARNFVTLFYGILNTGTGLLRYANAGQNNPLTTKDDGCQDLLPTTGPALGLLADPVFEVHEYQLQKNELLVLFTDGISETMNGQNLEFGEDRLLRICKENRRQDPRCLLELIRNDLSGFSGQSAARDDRTLFILKRK